MKTSICIANLNDHADLQATIALAYASSHKPHEVIVCDDGSESLPDLSSWLERDDFKLYRNATRQGSGPAKHAAMDQATGDLVFILDSHIRLHWQAVERVVREAQKNKLAMFCMVCRGFDDGPFKGKGAYLTEGLSPQAKWRPDNVKCNALMGGCYAIPNHLLKFMRGYAPGLKGWGYEEEWLAMRAQALGLETHCVEDAYSEHQFQRVISRPVIDHGDGDWEYLYNRHAACIMTHGPEIWEREVKHNINPALSAELTAAYPKLINVYEWLSNATNTLKRA